MKSDATDESLPPVQGGGNTENHALFWIGFSPQGEPLPSTMREKPGDCLSAIRKTKQKYRGVSYDDCDIRRVKITWEPQES